MSYLYIKKKNIPNKCKNSEQQTQSLRTTKEIVESNWASIEHFLHLFHPNKENEKKTCMPQGPQKKRLLDLQQKILK